MLGPEHTDTLSSLNQLGEMLQAQGKYGDAEEIHQRTLDRYQKTLKLEHAEALRSAKNLALVFQGQGKHSEAEKILRRAVDRMEGGVRSRAPRYFGGPQTPGMGDSSSGGSQ